MNFLPATDTTPTSVTRYPVNERVFYGPRLEGNRNKNSLLGNEICFGEKKNYKTKARKMQMNREPYCEALTCRKARMKQQFLKMAGWHWSIPADD